MRLDTTLQALNNVLAAGRRAHFIGIGGISMNGLARVLLARGWQVSGSDMTDSELIGQLRALGATVAIGHAAANLPEVDLVVRTDAVTAENPELVLAQQRGYLVVRRSQLLGRLTAQFKSIAVSGTHGKTTTSAMTTQVLLSAGLSPTAFLGGEYGPIGGTCRVGDGAWAVVEACEAFASFLDFTPTVAVITNVEPEHLDYHGTVEALHQAFVQFLGQLQPGGGAVICYDDPVAVKLAQRAGVQQIVGYALETDAYFTASDIRRCGLGSEFTVLHAGQPVAQVKLQVPGRHNIANALAALAAASLAGIAPDVAAAGLGQFCGVNRRFQIISRAGGVTLVDDYSHHPTEMAAAFAAIRAHCTGRLLVIFQPHLFSRTRTFMREFAQLLASADLAWVTDIYPAREEPIPGVDAAQIAQLASKEFGGKVEYLPFESVAANVISQLQQDDIVVTMGAGNVDRIARGLAGLLSNNT